MRIRLGCENVMIQLLISLIEWFAVAGLSVLGISYELPQPCSAPEPTEFRQTISWTQSDEFALPMPVSSRDCIAGADTLIHGSEPYFLTPSGRYDS
ncbi:MAG: hypothetical protein ACI82N_000116 [Maricaulis sp.]|jgi:hypothetical protein